jgi:hypothetical protein
MQLANKLLSDLSAFRKHTAWLIAVGEIEIVAVIGRERRGYKINAAAHCLPGIKHSTRHLADLTSPSFAAAVIAASHADEGRHA